MPLYSTHLSVLFVLEFSVSRKFKVCVHGPKYLVISKYFSITFQVLSYVKIDNASGEKEDVLHFTQTLIQRNQHV